MAAVLLILLLGVGLILIPLGLPGLWVMLLGLLTYGWLTGFRTLGAGLVIAALALALLGEAAEWWVGFRTTKRYGGSRRAGWGALIGGIVGAVVGVPVPIIGSVIGSFIGSFAGAVVFEYSREMHAPGSLRAGWGALVGRAVAAAVKIAFGLGIAVIGVWAMLR